MTASKSGRSVLDGVGGAAAIAGGTLRLVAAASVSPMMPVAKFIYLVIDCLLLLALVAICARDIDELGAIGAVAVCCGASAICVIRSQGSLGPASYLIGATMLDAALIAIGVRLRRDRFLSGAAGVGSTSMLLGGLSTVRLVDGGVAMSLAGGLFGLGFACVGFSLLVGGRYEVRSRAS